MARRWTPMVVAVLLVAVLAAPARAIGAFGPPVGIDDPTCTFDAFNVDQVQDASGVTHGFSGLWGSGCNESFVISYYEGSGTTWSLEATPYRGFVVATAWDTTGSYLLYMDPALKLRITKRLTSGTYIQGRLLSTNLGPDGSLAQGDVVATGGRWWAVWREHVGPGGGPGDEFDQTELFQAYTVGGTFVPRERITSNARWDSAPTLALTPATSLPIRLVWARGGSDFAAEPSDLRRALGDAGGGWISTTLATAGFNNFWPDVQMSGTTYVTWNRDGRTVQANNASGTFLSHTFVTPAAQNHRPRIAVTPGHVVVGWTSTASSPFAAFVAERVGTSWSGTVASPGGVTRLQLLMGVASTGGNATATILSLGSRLYAAAET